ncbi:MAG: ATP-binding protein [Nanoarchaeota archaeon]|nr:ATP-binding protein [Nanoarchaeota archaeon]MBU1005718.1 ATP-binding protein [Nanoarchaeota archaeon]MBU1945597.1 ATP-binding protein [Nanoarchaeota archaeon]
MKSIVVLSGKGGVGKSSIAASLAVAFSKDKQIVCADCDVDASNLSLLFGLSTKKYSEWKPLSTNQAALVDMEKCTGCGKCIGSCYFNALDWKGKKPELKKFGCEGCGVCELVCAVNAIKLYDIDNAFIGYAKTNKGFFIASAQLLPGNSGSGKVVSAVRKKAKEIEPKAELMVIDAAAGIGCPVIASVSGNDYSVLVTEPTPSGYEDMLRALEIVDHFRIKKGIIINKYNLNKEYSEKIEFFAKKNKITILNKIPFDKAFVNAMTKMVPIIDYSRDYSPLFDEIKNKIIEELTN